MLYGEWFFLSGGFERFSIGHSATLVALFLAANQGVFQSIDIPTITQSRLFDGRQ